MRDSLDVRYWITWAGAALRRQARVSDTEAIAEALGVAERTVRHWRAQNAAPPWALRVLMHTVTGIPTYAENWNGWRFKPAPGGAVLGGPAGEEWTPADLAHVRTSYARLRALETAIAPGAQLTWTAPGTGRRTTWPGGETPTWAQLEEALRGVVDDAMRRRA